VLYFTRIAKRKANALLKRHERMQREEKQRQKNEKIAAELKALQNRDLIERMFTPAKTEDEEDEFDDDMISEIE
jgi:hypothetical protein